MEHNAKIRVELSAIVSDAFLKELAERMPDQNTRVEICASVKLEKLSISQESIDSNRLIAKECFIDGWGQLESIQYE